MDAENTKAAWQSRAVMLPLVGLIAYVLQQSLGLSVPVEVQGMVVDLVPALIAALMTAGMWFRVKARAIIDRWF